ncbi:probable ATP-dependent RNA helicase DHX35 [Homarus americanus]|uniref:probable ATP-dependent RNA helicase DHX35 n=1 Tax=Homarus americanus TaxID=6706 RepID=UPI001C481E33|nr:probable ATP-dependent RNA helicase DHX35 [Homarus americanus]XP_042242789.1 probable ATP-dependent RNA helicase DHX35 [Homarus americanus]
MSLKPKFLKPGDDIYAEDRSDVDQTSGTTFIYNPHRSLSIEKQRQRLPVFRARNHILYLVEKYQTTVVVGETGSGKSTQIPQYLRDAGWAADGIIGIAQPRRVACTTLAERVAEECDVMLGKEVGYSIRFDDCSTPGTTQIKYMTEGLLVREMMADPLLRQYCVILLDEVHERTLYTDIVLGLMKKILRRRKDLRLIICSATIDADQLYNFFNYNTTGDKDKDTVSVLSVEGRTHPIDVCYLEEPAPEYVKGSAETVMKIHRKEGAGDVLVFLTGAEEVDTCVSLLKEHAATLKKNEGSILVLPMHGALSNSDQLRVFHSAPPGVRKVIVATNIAETSVTIPGIVYVIDCGFVKVRWYNSTSHTDALVVVPTSQASATQRAGRAGRTRSGKVYRLYPEEEFRKLSEITPPEMVRTNLSSAVLNLMALGIENMLRFDFPSPPPAKHLTSALDELYALGALTEEGTLTKPLGQQMAEFPLSPQLAKMLLVSGDFGCSQEILSIVAMLQVQNVFTKPRGQEHRARVIHRNFQVNEGDLITLLNVFTGYQKHAESRRWCVEKFINHRALRRAAEIRGRMEKLLVNFDIPLTSCEGGIDAVCRCITAGMFPNAAFLHHSGFYHTVRGNQPLHIHPSSVLYTETQPQWVLFQEVLHTSQMFMRDLTVIDPAWLLELAPHFYEKRTMQDH